MAKKVKFDCVVTTGEYKDAKGEKKYSNQNVGVVFEDENGNMDMKLNVYPLPNSNGDVWIKFFERKAKNENESKED